MAQDRASVRRHDGGPRKGHKAILSIVPTSPARRTVFFDLPFHRILAVLGRGGMCVVFKLLILGWEPLSVSVTFTTLGSTVGLSGRGMAFALQSIQKRLPKMLGPLLAGYVLYRAERALGSPEAGRIAGMRWLVGLSLVLGVASLLIPPP
jgi:hypothetical protein